MKKFLVVLLACAMIFGFASTALAADSQITEFSDIADQSVAARNAIMKLAVLGVIEGNEGIGGAFRPADNLTRAEFAKIVCYLTDNVKIAESLAGVGTKFSDVSTGNWYTGWVNAAAQSGYFQGDPGGTFRPNANITMQEVVAVALRAAGYTDKLPGNWPGNYVTKASNVGLLDDVKFVGSAAATRSDMAIICEAVLGINMVVHIDSDIAFGLSLAQGTADPDGFSEIYYISNETNRGKTYETILHKAFKGMYYDVQVNPAYAYASVDADGKVTPTLQYDESHGWSYADYSSGELALNVFGSFVYDGDKKFEKAIPWDEDKKIDWEYDVADELASTYYITRDFDLTELAAMQVQLTVIDGKEICFVDVVSSYQTSPKIHQDRAASNNSLSQNIMVDGKSFRVSNTMYLQGKMGNLVADGDYANEYYSGWNKDANNGAGAQTLLRNLGNSDNDNTFGGKIYLDKDGRIYGVKNYDAYDLTSFGVYDKEDSSRAEWKELFNQNTDDMKFETNKPYTLYKDGEQIKAEDLEENDLVSRLNSNGAPFFYATAPQEGELTNYNKQNNKLTLGGTGYKVVPRPSNFVYSDDGGDTFAIRDLDESVPDFGEAEFALAYNFNKVAYVAANLSNQKIIGVITKIEPSYNWNATSGGRDNRYEEVTLYNAEGKEVTYKFTSTFRDAYNWQATQVNTVGATFKYGTAKAADWDKVKNAGANLPQGRTAQGEEIKSLLAKGDIVQIVVDKNDAVKRLDNYAKFELPGASAKVNSSTKRITIPGGTYTMNDEAIVFNVTVDDKAYDDVSIQSVASVLAKDFDASKIVAFDVKAGARIAALYIIDDTSVYQYGIISGQGKDSTGEYYTINGNKVYCDGLISTGNIPAIVSYQVSGGEAKLTAIAGYSEYLALGKARYYSDVAAAVKSVGDTNTFAITGTVESYSSSTKALKINGIYVYVTDKTYLYDLVKDDDVSTAADLKDKTVMAFYDKDNNAYFVGVVGGTAQGGGVTPPVVTGVKDLAAVGGNRFVDLTWSAATGASRVQLQISLDGVTFTPMVFNTVVGTPDAMNTAIYTTALSATSTGVRVTGLINGVTYYFKLVVTDGAFAGDSNKPSAAPAFATVQSLTAAPTGTSGQIKLDWAAATGANAGDIEIYISLTGNTNYTTGWEKLVVGPGVVAVGTDLNGAILDTSAFDGTTLTGTVTGLVSDTRTYYFYMKVAAGNFVGNSNIVSAQPQVITQVARPTLALAKVNEVDLALTAPAAGATDVKMQISLGGSGAVSTWTWADLSTTAISGQGNALDGAKLSGTLAVGDTSATVTGLKGATDYRFRLVVTGGTDEGNGVESVAITPLALLTVADLSTVVADITGVPVAGATTASVGNPSLRGVTGKYTVTATAWAGTGVSGANFQAGDAVYVLTLAPTTNYTFTGLTADEITAIVNQLETLFVEAMPDITAVVNAGGNLVVTLSYPVLP